MREFLAKNKTVILPQPPYSPDLEEVYFSIKTSTVFGDRIVRTCCPLTFLFPKPMKGMRFTTIEEIKEKSKQELLAMWRFQKCFADWKKCWHKCIICEGGYFEGVKIVVNK